MIRYFYRLTPPDMSAVPFYIAPNFLGYPLNTALKSSYAFLMRSSSRLLNFLGCLALSMKRRPSSPYIGIVGLGSKHSIEAISDMYLVFNIAKLHKFLNLKHFFWVLNKKTLFLQCRWPLE